MHIEIGVFEAKSKLSQILQEVKKGKHFTITVRGYPIADLIPSESSTFIDTKAAINSMRNISKIKNISDKTLTEWISEGRK
jgi:prevent-host-death family protein